MKIYRVPTEIGCPECGKNMTKNHLQRHRDVIHLNKEKGEKDSSECKECGYMRDLQNETDENRDTEHAKNIKNEMSPFTTGLKEVRSQCIKGVKEMNSKSMLKHMCT